jgi:predicted hydrolase (HD superfamily)
MTITDLQTAVRGLNPYQIEQVSSQVAKYLKLNEELKQTRPTVCPVCDTVDARFIKKGIQAGKQRSSVRNAEANSLMIRSSLQLILTSQSIHG